MPECRRLQAFAFPPDLYSGVTVLSTADTKGAGVTARARKAAAAGEYAFHHRAFINDGAI